MTKVFVRKTFLFDADDEDDLTRRICAFRAAIRARGGTVLAVEHTSAPPDRGTARIRYEVPVLESWPGASTA